MGKRIIVVVVLSVLVSTGAAWAEGSKGKSLYERLGGKHRLPPWSTRSSQKSVETSGSTGILQALILQSSRCIWSIRFARPAAVRANIPGGR